MSPHFFKRLMAKLAFASCLLSFITLHLLNQPLYSQDSQTLFEIHQSIPIKGEVKAIETGDLNGDGALELLISAYESDPTVVVHNALYLNDGRGSFGKRHPMGYGQSN